MIDFTVNGRDYHLKLTTRTALDLEKKMGTSLLSALEGDSLRQQLLVLSYAFRKFHPDVQYEQVLDLYDEWIEEGHDRMDLSLLVLDILRDSGVLGKIDMDRLMNDPNSLLRAKMSSQFNK